MKSWHLALHTVKTSKLKLSLPSLPFEVKLHKREVVTFWVLSANLLAVLRIDGFKFTRF